MTEQP
jgi:DNA mismatch repair protein MSH2